MRIQGMVSRQAGTCALRQPMRHPGNAVRNLCVQGGKKKAQNQSTGLFLIDLNKRVLI